MKNPFAPLKILCCLLIGYGSLNAQTSTPQFEWAKGFGGFFGDVGNTISVDFEGNIITAGTFTESVNFNPSADTTTIFGQAGDAFITKHNAQGELIWVKHFGGEMQDGVLSATSDESGNIYLAGYFSLTVDFNSGNDVFELTSSGGFDIFILKLNANGEFQWVKKIGGTGLYDWAEEIIYSPLDGSLHITGHFSETLNFETNEGILSFTSINNSTDIFVARYSNSGNFSWAKHMGSDDFDAGMGVAIDKQNNVYVTGIFANTANFNIGLNPVELTSNGQADIFICKLKTDGSLTWVKGFGDEGQDWGYDIAVDFMDNVLITGMFSGNIDFNPDTPNVNVLISQLWDILVLKLNTNGSYIWARNFGGVEFDWGNAIAVDKLGDIYTTGWFSKTADFNPSDAIFELTAGGHYDIFIHKLDASGNFVWAGQLEGNQIFDLSDNMGNEITVDDNFNIYTTGQFHTYMDCDPGPNVSNIIAVDDFGSGFFYQDVFIQKMSQEIFVSIDNQSAENQIKYYPNPTSGNLNIELNTEFKSINVSIIDVTGKVVHQQSFNNINLINIHLDISNGLYFIQLSEKNNPIGHFKILKM